MANNGNEAVDVAKKLTEETGTGWWIKFTSPVPLGKPVTIIHNLDK